MREEIAGLVMVGFEGTALSPFVRRAVVDAGVGGVIFLGRNVESEGQLSALCDGIVRLSPRGPRFLALDQEGGRVNRVGGGMEVLPGNMALGAARSAALSRRAGRMTALQVGELGLNLVLAPVLDVISTLENSVIGTRSYGGDPRLVAELGSSYIEGIREGGALSTAKHFPGLGRARFDPHHEATPIDALLEELRRDDIPPFRESLPAGPDFIMTSHALYPCLDSVPATLSKNVLSGLLRQEMKYGGAIISDDLCMKAISGKMGVGEAALRFLRAGGDMVLICDGEECLDEVIGELERAVERGELSPREIRESRLRLSAALGGLRRVGGAFSREAMAALSLEIARASVTAYRVKEGALPLKPGPGDRVCIVEVKCTAGEEGPSIFSGLFRGRHPGTDSIPVGIEPSDEEIRLAAGRAAVSSFAVVITHDCHRHARQLELVEAVVETCGSVICIAAGIPYDVVRLEGAPVVLATYGSSAASMAAAVEVLFGDIEARGRAPVRI